MIVAVIEIGSHGLRLEVARCEGGLSQTQFTRSVHHDLIQLVHRRDGLAAFESAVVPTLAAWIEDCRQAKVDKRFLVATEVGRRLQSVDATFWKRAGLTVNTLNAEQEARFGFLAAAGAKRLNPGIFGTAVLDVGNGSTDISFMRTDGEFVSWNREIGARSIAERYVQCGGRSPSMRTFVQMEILPANDALRAPLELIAIGGFATKVAWQIVRPNETERFSLRALDGCTIGASSFEENERTLRAMIDRSGAEAAARFVDRFDPAVWRLAQVVAGLRFFNEVCSCLQLGSIVISVRSLRHGIAAEACRGGSVVDELLCLN